MKKKKFKVEYSAHSNHEWSHTDHEEIIEAYDEEDVKKIVKNWDDYSTTYFVERIKEYEDQ